MKRRLALIAILCTCTFSLPSPNLSAQSYQSDIALLNTPGHHLIMRHAIAPGMGDPRNFRLDDCTTQRNLSSTGQEQARHIGDIYKTADIVPTLVLSSKWCRTLETAELLDLGPVTPFNLLDSIWTRSPEHAQLQTQNLKDYLKDVDDEDRLFMVTHAVNISALTGRNVPSGHGLIITMKNDQVIVAGELSP